MALDPVLATQATSTGASFETSAEASERTVPIGSKAALEVAESFLGMEEEPPLPYPREQCEDVFVYIVTLAEGAPEHSAASLGLGKEGPARLRYPGERIGEWTVLAIADDWTGLNPEVWLEKDGTACKAELAGNPARNHSSLKPSAPSRPPPRRAKRRRR